jgi:5'-nucleotidase/UDP-sugar diphosphatase
MSQAFRRGSVAAVAALALAGTGAVTAGTAAAAPPSDRPAFTLTIAHNNDGESSLLPTVEEGIEVGGVARFASVVDRLEREATTGRPGADQAGKRGFLLLNSGDNYLAGAQLNASFEDGAPFYDAVAVDYLDYDVLAIGNHEFDFGPDVLERFVREVPDETFVSANLDFSAEPGFDDLIAAGRIVPSTVVRERGEEIGVIGLTTPLLRGISSPRDVVIDPAIVEITQAEVDRLTAQGVDKIILQSHLQNIREEVALVAQVRGVDAVIGGGGGELLAAPQDVLIPGDTADAEYPLVATDLDGRQVPVVTTLGNYRYVGNLVLNFDKEGDVLDWDEERSGVRRVVSEGADAVEPDQFLLNNVEKPVAEYVDELAQTVLAQNPYVLQCERSDVRGGLPESNCGNLVVDAHLATARERAAQFGVTPPVVAVQNGGGVRGEVDQPAGPVTVLDTFRLQPFGNFLAVAPEVSREDFRQLLEEGVNGSLPGDGGFVHAAGFRYTFDTSFQARVSNVTGETLTPGQRIRSVVLDDGTVLVQDGAVVAGPAISVAGLAFSLNGGDQYPAQDSVTLGITDQQSLERFLVEDLGGVVPADYAGPEGRITRQ